MPTRPSSVLGLMLLTALRAWSAPVDFNREVRPILSDKCYHCHGPDESARKARLRLDTRDGALREHNGATVILPGRGAASEVILRVTSTDPEEVMPPPEAKLGRLTADEVATLRRWIDEGATYQSHWSFTPVAGVNVPAAPDGLPRGVHAHNPIDRLVFRRLAELGRAPQPEADRATLIRRVSFDLTGLPPTPAEVTAFVADNSPGAYARLVDRLLASPRYGERMAVDWLDLARYADSYGFQVDRERDMWPWRDWVIGAFNRNLPWNDFVTWQLAGDLLPGATDEQVLATAFNRLHAQESEGGSVEEEYRVNYVNDRVTTFGTAFLGLTLECARCHDHKFDPISQKDFYRLFAFFDDIDEAGLYSFFTQSMPTPTMVLPDARLRQRQEAAAVVLREAVARHDTVVAGRGAEFAAWLAARPAGQAGIADELAWFDFERREAVAPPAKASPAATGKPGAKGKGKAGSPTPAADAAEPVQPSTGRFESVRGVGQTATTARENLSVPGRAGLALQLTGDHPVTTSLGNFHRHDPFTVALWLQVPDVKERAVILHRSRAWTDAGSRGYELLIEEGRLKWSLIHFWPGDAISIRAIAPLPVATWTHVTVTNDGSGRAAGLRILVDGSPVAVEVVRDNLTKDITGGGGDTIALGERFRDRGLKGGLVDDLRVFGRDLTPLEVRELSAPGALERALARDEATLTSVEREELREHFLASHDGPAREARRAVTEARAAVTALAEEARDIMVMRDLPQPRTAYVLKRGDYAQRGEPVEPGTPDVLPPFPADQPRNRLGLARWLTDPRHPLLARVTVNRFWQAAFGTGLVRTVDDLGSQGDRPEHPELLDWLAADFIRSGWDVKALLRTIVTSHTYRQASFGSAELQAEDPENRWLARGPRHRLPAEMIRDNALAVSGLLVERMGGAPVHTYDLPESFKPAPAGKGEALYRRSLYTFWRRNGPAPVLEAFDVPKRVVCVAKRDTTNTPLHALVLLNGPQFVEAARVLAETLQRTAGSREVLVADAFARLTCRPADPVERGVLVRMYDEQLAWFRQRPDDAARYLAIGATPRDPALPAPEVAAAATVINTLMNHDAFIVKR